MRNTGILPTSQAADEVEDQKEYFISEWLSRRAKSYWGEKTANKQWKKTYKEVK